MNHATIRFHEKVIRLMKGIITAWEDWLKEEAQQQKVAQPSTGSVKQPEPIRQ